MDKHKKERRVKRSLELTLRSTKFKSYHPPAFFFNTDRHHSRRQYALSLFTSSIRLVYQ